MKIAIIGAGALGSTIGGKLALGGEEVNFLTSNEERAQHGNQKGLYISEGENEHQVVYPHYSTKADEIGVCDLIIVLVKSFSTKEAITNGLALIGENSVVLTLQNGVGNEDVIASVVGSERVLSGRTYVGGVMSKEGLVKSNTYGRETIIGELSGEITKRVERICQTFNQAGLLCTVSDNIQGLIWDKLLINASTGPITALTRLVYGELYQHKSLEKIGLEVISEGIKVAEAMGIKLTPRTPLEIWELAASGLAYDFKTSMLQGVEKMKPSEIDYTCGAIARYGALHGQATPVNTMLTALVKGLERSFDLEKDCS